MKNKNILYFNHYYKQVIVFVFVAPSIKMCDDFKPECAPECAPEFFKTMDSNIRRSQEQIDILVKKIMKIMYSDNFNAINADFTICMNLMSHYDKMTKNNATYDDYEKFYRCLTTSITTKQPVVLV